MRILIAAAAIVFGIAGANAADLDYSRDYSAGYSGLGYRSTQLMIYDTQPGVVVRAYWRAPWGHRHYYPTTGEKPEVGRAEDLSAVSVVSAPPETFERTWSTSSIFPPDKPRYRARIQEAPPEAREEQFSPPPLRGK